MTAELLKAGSDGKQLRETEAPAGCFCCGLFVCFRRFLSPHRLSKGDTAALAQTQNLLFVFLTRGIRQECPPLVSLTAAPGALQRKEPTKLLSELFPGQHPFLFLLDAQMWSAA